MALAEGSDVERRGSTGWKALNMGAGGGGQGQL